MAIEVEVGDVATWTEGENVAVHWRIDSIHGLQADVTAVYVPVGVCSWKVGSKSYGSIDDIKRIVTKNKKSMSVKSLYRGIFTKEPQKSRIKAGITDESGALTTEGKDVLLQFMFDGGEIANFDKEVVAPIIEAMKETK
jgi:hypothetical protein